MVLERQAGISQCTCDIYELPARPSSMVLPADSTDHRAIIDNYSSQFPFAHHKREGVKFTSSTRTHICLYNRSHWQSQLDVTFDIGNAHRHQPSQQSALPRRIHRRLLPQRLPAPPQTSVAAIRTPGLRFHAPSAKIILASVRLLPPRFLLYNEG